MASTAVTACSTCELHAEAVFRVEGMDCSEEVVILERRLKPLAGVESLSADLVGQRLHVKYDAAKLTTAVMVDAVGQTGMRMWLEHEEPVNTGDVTRRAKVLVACAASASVGVAASAAGLETWSAVAFASAAVLGGIYPVDRAVRALRLRTVDINVLMVIAVVGALALGEWFEAASVVLLFAAAQWLEVRTLEHARQAIRALIDLSPREAIVRRNGVEHRTSVDDVVVGDEIGLRPGDKVPLDGVIVGGRGDLNEAPLTGESLPVDKGPGDEVFAGTINGRGALDVRVTRLVRDTRLAHVIHLVETAQASRAPVQSFVDRFARWYTPAVIAAALAVAAVPLWTPAADAGVWIYRSLVLLVISCPCALVISTPVSIVSALSAAARHGVLVKGGVQLERLAATRVVAFDKTGTLTTGDLRVTDLMPAAGTTARELLALAAAAEARSEHPVARAIVRRAREDGLDVARADALTALTGLGAEADVSGRRVLVGSEALFRERGLAAEGAEAVSSIGAASLKAAGRTLVLVAADGRVLGAIGLADRPRDTAKETVDLLRQQGVARAVLLTGDHAAAAGAVADAVGLDEHHSSLAPAEKHAHIDRLRRAHGPVVMVGDGVNDAPALAAADVGVAMGAAGSDVAIETADVALMSSELLKLAYVLRLARATLRNVRTNVALSLALKAVFLVMAVTGSATLWMAVLADTGASVIVVGNALRLLRAR